MSRLTRQRQPWLLAESEDGSWSVTHGRRQLAIDLLSRSSAIAYLRDLHVSGDRIYIVEPDGYRVDITNDMTRLGVINRASDGTPRRPTPGERWSTLAATRRAARRRSELP